MVSLAQSNGEPEMTQFNELPSFSFFQKMFDFIVTQIRSSFFKGLMTDAEFIAGMQIITGISVKVYNLTDHIIVLSQSDFNLLESAYKAMKEELQLLSVKSEMDALIITDTISGYEKAFEAWRLHIKIEE